FSTLRIPNLTFQNTPHPLLKLPARLRSPLLSQKHPPLRNSHFPHQNHHPHHRIIIERNMPRIILPCWKVLRPPPLPIHPLPHTHPTANLHHPQHPTTAHPRAPHPHLPHTSLRRRNPQLRLQFLHHRLRIHQLQPRGLPQHLDRPDLPPRKNLLPDSRGLCL